MVVRAWIAAGLLLALLSAEAHAQAWARKMFKVTEHDFGTVAKGSNTEFDFELQNIFEEDVHLSHVRSSCGCTEPQITRQTLKTWEKSAIRAVFNTRSFIGSRSATLTVVIDQPYYAEVQLSVRGYIRGDVLFTPGSVAFGEVEEGGTPERWIAVSYAGRSDWSIVDVRSANASLEVELTEPERKLGRVSYKMLVRLKGDAPAGYLQEPLTIVTNDAHNSSLELPVEGRVVSPLTVSPASLFLGVLKPGETVEKRLFVKGTKPFRILSIECEGDCFKFATTDEVSATHLIPLTYTAGQASGKVAQKIAIRTDLGSGAVATCVASGTIAEGAASAPAPMHDEGG